MNTERIVAMRLRPGDQLVVPGEGLLPVHAVVLSADAVRIRSHTHWWEVPLSTSFLRVRNPRRIEMRPDLRGGDQ